MIATSTPSCWHRVRTLGQSTLIVWRWLRLVGTRGDAALKQVSAQPVCIKSPIRQHMPGRQVLQKSAGFAQVMGLPRHQAEINEVGPVAVLFRPFESIFCRKGDTPWQPDLPKNSNEMPCALR